MVGESVRWRIDRCGRGSASCSARLGRLWSGELSAQPHAKKNDKRQGMRRRRRDGRSNSYFNF
eukprot:scaffold93197_cov30-Tisochrysis_lutea.AAC.1